MFGMRATEAVTILVTVCGFISTDGLDCFNTYNFIDNSIAAAVVFGTNNNLAFVDNYVNIDNVQQRENYDGAGQIAMSTLRQCGLRACTTIPVCQVQVNAINVSRLD
jgi:hypothetical protein